MTVEIKNFKALWGMEDRLEDNMRKIAEAGFAGVEAPLPVIEEVEEFKRLLKEFNLEFIAMIFADDINSFEQQAMEASTFHPVMINSHSSKDDLDINKQLHFFEQSLRIEEKLECPVGHETHRGRAMYTPWNTAKILSELPELKITADFSHWVCVCERLLEDQQEHLKIAIEKTIHIHGRVGHMQGPQVSDPRAPEFHEELRTHVEWWKQIYSHKMKEGKPLTFTAEYGPPGYMQTLPYTEKPVSDLWDICLWTTEYFNKQVKNG